jgi:DNA-binding transcriptional regulator YiaG
VDIDHLILAMTRIDQCVGSLILRSLGLDLDDVRIKIAFALGRTADWESGAGEPPGSLWELLNQQAYRRQVSISGLAARIGTRERILRQWISGTRKPSGKSCDAVAAAFQIDPNLVRRLAGRPPVAMTARRSGRAGEDRRQQLIAEMRTMFNAVDWSEERIARMTTLLRTMVRNDREQAKLNGDELSP